jgi:hypothetical protein
MILVRASGVIITRVVRCSLEFQDPHKRCKIFVRVSGTILTRVARSLSELKDPHKNYILVTCQSFRILARGASPSQSLRNDPHESCKILIRASETSQEVQDQELEGPF